MATSPEKVHALIDQLAGQLPARVTELQQQASGMAAVALGGLAPFLPSLLPQVVDQVRANVPDDAAALDAILDAAAAHVLTLKSDPPAIDSTADVDQAADVARPLHAGPEGGGLVGHPEGRPVYRDAA